MPRLSVWFLRASLIYLAAGFTLGALMLANKGLGFYPALWSVLPIHMETLLAGWFLQLAIGMAFWILPRYRQGPPRGNEKLVWFSFGLLNLGIGLVIAGSIISASGLIFLGRIAELSGVLACVIGLWGRVKPFN